MSQLVRIDVHAFSLLDFVHELKAQFEGTQVIR